MIDNVSGTPQAVADGGAALGTETSGGTPATVSENASGTSEPKTLTIPTHVMKRIKDEERTKGKEEALQSIVTAAGFSSQADLVAVLAKLKNSPASMPEPSRTQPKPTPNSDRKDEAEMTAEELRQSKNARREEGRFQRQVERLMRERDTAIQKASTNDRRVRELQSALDAKEAEAFLREIAVSEGVKDIDYAMKLYSREVNGKSEEELAKIDERAFFQGLKKSKPYLFGEIVELATTGTGSGGPPAPKPGPVIKETAQNEIVDARKLSPKEYNELLKKRGLSVTA